MAVLRGTGLLSGKAAHAVLIVLVLAVLDTLSWRHANLYRDGTRFFTHVVAYHPTAATNSTGARRPRLWHRIELQSSIRAVFRYHLL